MNNVNLRIELEFVWIFVIFYDHSEFLSIAIFSLRILFFNLSTNKIKQTYSMILMQSHREEFFFKKIKGYFRFKPSLHPDEKKSLEI